MASWGAHSMHLTFLGSLGISCSEHFHNIRWGTCSNTFEKAANNWLGSVDASTMAPKLK